MARRNKDGTFVESGNPGGRPKAPIRFRELYDANNDDDKNYARLVHWRDQDEHPQISMKAIEMLMSRRYGGVATVDDNGETVKDTQIVIVRQNAKDIAYTPEPSE